MIDSKNQPANAVSDEYRAGQGCTCFAWSRNECACDADWTDPEVYRLRNELTAMRESHAKLLDAMKTASKLLDAADCPQCGET